QFPIRRSPIQLPDYPIIQSKDCSCGTSHITEADARRSLSEPEAQGHVRHVGARSRRVEVLRHVVRFDTLLVCANRDGLWSRWATGKSTQLPGAKGLLSTLRPCKIRLGAA